MARVSRAVIEAVAAGLLGLAALSALAGTWRWLGAWAFALVFGLAAFSSAKAFRDSPGLAEERKTAARKARSLDRFLVAAMNTLLPLTVVLGGLDKRLTWFPALPPALTLAAFPAALAADLLTYRALRANAFFSSHVRIQADRGQVVVDGAPYSVIRHPGYAGALLFNLALPPLLCSVAACFSAGLMLPLLVIRILLEEKILLSGLEGYAAYTQRVRWRLAPWIW